MVIWIHNNQQNMAGNISRFVVNTVPADGLALLGTRAYAGTVTVKYGGFQGDHLPNG